jgi:hypothetical protein
MKVALPYFPYFEKIKVDLCYLHAVLLYEVISHMFLARSVHQILLELFPMIISTVPSSKPLCDRLI